MFRRLCLSLGLALFCLSAAAKAPPLPMPVADDLQVELVLNQQELAVDVPNNAGALGGQFGLIGAIIGSAIVNSQTKNAEEAVAPLRDLLVEYRFNPRLEAALRTKLATAQGISPKATLTVLQTPWDARQANQAPTATTAMVLVPRYAMDHAFNRLNVSLATSVVERTRKSNGKYKTKVLFNRTYAFDFPITADLGGQEPVQAWAALKGAGLAQLLDQGIEQTTDMLVHDFSAEGRGQWLQTGKGQVAKAGAQTYPGMQVREGDGWVWVRGGKGYFHALQGHRPLDAAAMSALAAVAAPAETAPAATPTAADANVPAPVATTPAATPAAADANVAAPAAPAAQASAPVAAPAAAAPETEAGTAAAGQGD